MIIWTCASFDEARTVVRELVEKKLIACGNIIPNVESIYEWEGKIETSQEVKVFLKTIEEKFESVRELIIQKCSYAVPKISAFDVDMGNPAYLSWVETSL